MQIEWWAMIPFVVMLLSIAICPLLSFTARLWHHNSFQLAVSLVLGGPVLIWFLCSGLTAKVVHTGWEYIQFIVLLFALFVVSGGIYLRGDIRATPRNNTLFIGLGGLIASLVGTTGAAMLLIRPILNTNKERKHKVHTVLFTIFVAANCGGLLTPLGDPPLFLGYLRGVPFTWTLRMIPEWLVVNGLLLLTYWALDRRYFAHEPGWRLRQDEREVEPLKLEGKLNFLWFLAIILAVSTAHTLDLHAIMEGHASFWDWVPEREIIMLLAALASYFSGSKRTRWVDNEFEWGPIKEVAALFLGIFSTMMPALIFLEQIAPKLPLNTLSFYGFTGSLSAFLDNAPTYATFFQMASTLPEGMPRVAGVYEQHLLAISLAAVLFGAMTYIGNGPNFMIKSVADARGVEMPAFGGYIVLSVRYLLPVLLSMGLVFLETSWPVKVIGLVGMALVILRAALIAYYAPKSPLEKRSRKVNN